jgi:hypothetical protein
MTEKYSITDWTYQQTPDSIIWCVRADGALLGITYQREHKVVGWHRHVTQGDFVAIATIPGDTREDDVWVTVKRTIDGTDKWYVERLYDWFKEDSAEHGRFLDSYATYVGAATDTVTGLDHLAGETVGVLADGTVHPPVVVSGTGSLTLNKEYYNIVVGLPFVSEVQPMLPEVEDREGTSLGRMQRITQVSIDFYKSLGCTIGRIDEEGNEITEDVPFRVPGDLLGNQVPLYTGWYDLDFPEGFGRDSNYFIRQTQPLPMTIRSVVDSVEVYK